jgi:hypothetical protein
MTPERWDEGQPAMIDVHLVFELAVEGDADAKRVGQEFCRLINDMPQIGNADWIATPRSVSFVAAKERP